MEAESFCSNRLNELAEKAYTGGIVLFSDFLDLNEQNILYHRKWKNSGISVFCSGGCDNAERQMAAFLPDALSLPVDSPEIISAVHFPICALLIRPSAPKFAEPLNHRDYLGAILNLGIDRSKIGDILVLPGMAYCICHEKIAGFIIDNLNLIRHTPVKSSLYVGNIGELAPETEEITGTVSSLRLDSVLALAFGKSRSDASRLIQDGKIFINARIITTNAYHLKAGDVISARGIGKCRFDGEVRETKKGRILVSINRYR